MNEIKNIAVVGAGFSGLATAIYLQLSKKVKVSIYEGDLPNEKASKVASGIIHPFPGQHCRPAKFFKEAIEEAFNFFSLISSQKSSDWINNNGIYRVALTAEQEREFYDLVEKFPFVKKCNEDSYPLKKGSHGIHIEMAKTIFSATYLKALENFFLKIGGVIIKRQLKSCSEIIADFDHIVVAAGRNSDQLLGLSKLKYHKGQILIGKFSKPVNIKQSISGKGYLAPTEIKDEYAIGSTYEHRFDEEGPTLYAKEKICSDALSYLHIEDFEVKEIRSGFRVTKKINGIPLVCKIDEKFSIISAMGSRGLLYHAYCAKILKEAILENKEIPKELKDF